MNKNELQRDKIQVDLLAALEDAESIKIDDVLEYTSPPVSYENNQLITEGRAKQLLGSSPGSGSILSYATGSPNISITESGVIVIFDSGYSRVAGIQVMIGSRIRTGDSVNLSEGVGGIYNGFEIDLPGADTLGITRVDFVAQ